MRRRSRALIDRRSVRCFRSLMLPDDGCESRWFDAVGTTSGNGKFHTDEGAELFAID